MKLEDITMLNENVLVRPDDMTKHKTLILLENNQQHESGTVLKVGPGETLFPSGNFRPNSCKPGDRVIFKEHSGARVYIDGVKHLIIADDFILAKKV